MAEMGGDVTLKLLNGNLGNRHDPAGIRVLRQRQQQVLQRNVAVPLLCRIVRRTPERFREVARGR